MSLQDSEKNKRLHETIADLGQPVSLADELRKLVERWREKAETLSRADLQLHGYHQNEISRLIVCADDISALLAQHAVAPDTRAGLYKQVPTSCMCGGNMAWVRIRESGAEEMVGCICHTFAHAAEQPKLTELRAVLKKWDSFHGYTAGQLVSDIRTLLTSPVAPPPPVYFANSHAVWDVSKIPAELVYPSPAVPADYHCTFCDGNHFENLCPNRCKPEDAAPPVAPGEQPPRKWICTCAEGKDGRPMLDEDCMVHAPDPAGAYAAPPATKLVDAWWDGAVLNESNYHELVQRINIALATAAKQAREEAAKEKWGKDLLTVGWHKGVMDFGVRCSLEDLDYEQMRQFREMTIVAIGVAEDMWRRARERASPAQCAAQPSPQTAPQHPARATVSPGATVSQGGPEQGAIPSGPGDREEGKE